jgi:Zn-dependent protease with chaperone function
MALFASNAPCEEVAAAIKDWCTHVLTKASALPSQEQESDSSRVAEVGSTDRRLCERSAEGEFSINCALLRTEGRHSVEYAASFGVQEREGIRYIKVDLSPSSSEKSATTIMVLALAGIVITCGFFPSMILYGARLVGVVLWHLHLLPAGLEKRLADSFHFAVTTTSSLEYLFSFICLSIALLWVWLLVRVLRRLRRIRDGITSAGAELRAAIEKRCGNIRPLIPLSIRSVSPWSLVIFWFSPAAVIAGLWHSLPVAPDLLLILVATVYAPVTLFILPDLLFPHSDRSSGSSKWVVTSHASSWTLSNFTAVIAFIGLYVVAWVSVEVSGNNLYIPKGEEMKVPLLPVLPFLLLFSPLVAGVILFASWKALLRVPWAWKEGIMSTEMIPVTTLAELPDKPRRRFFRLSLGIRFVFGALLNITSALVGVGAISSAISSDSYVCRGFALCGKAFVGNSTLLVLVGRFTCLLIPFFIVFFVFRRIIGLVASRAVSLQRLARRRQRPPGYLSDFASRLCTRYHIRAPIIKVVSSRRVWIKTDIGLLGWKAVIYITQGVLDMLDRDALCAAVAHEIGHIRRGLRRFKVSIVLSRLALFPHFFLSLWFDFFEEEFKADQFALSNIDDPYALSRALILMETYRFGAKAAGEPQGARGAKRVVSAAKKRVRKIVRSLIIWDQFFFGDGLLGYAHPYIADRVAAIALEAEARVKEEARTGAT